MEIMVQGWIVEYPCGTVQEKVLWSHRYTRSTWTPLQTYNSIRMSCALGRSIIGILIESPSPKLVINIKNRFSVYYKAQVQVYRILYKILRMYTVPTHEEDHLNSSQVLLSFFSYNSMNYLQGRADWFRYLANFQYVSLNPSANKNKQGTCNYLITILPSLQMKCSRFETTKSVVSDDKCSRLVTQICILLFELWSQRAYYAGYC